MVGTSFSNAGGVSSSAGLGAKIPDALWPKVQSITQMQYCNKFNKGFKSGPRQKKRKRERENRSKSQQVEYSLDGPSCNCGLFYP